MTGAMGVGEALTTQHPPLAATDATSAPKAGAPRACPVCSARGPFEAYTLREMFFGTREEFEYLRCSTCGVLWLADPPADLSPYYPPVYHTAGALGDGGPDGSAVSRWLHDERASHRLFGGHRIRAAIARRIGPELREEIGITRNLVRAAELRSFDDPILDVGSGPIPERLLQLSRAGFRNLLGIDPMIPGDTMVDGVEVRRQSIHELDGSFAMITLHHSFEHVGDPLETLVAARRLLRPGGAIVIRTPVMGTWFWEKYRTDWWELDPPRHLFVHTRRSIELLAEQAGLVIDKVKFESTFVEILASDQIVRGIPWRDPASCWSDLDAPRLGPSISAAEATVAKLNEEERGGRARFVLRALGT